MELTGEVESIIYKNDNNGYTIAAMNVGNEEVVVTGYLPFVNKGDSLNVVGKFVVHPDYGEQVKVTTWLPLAGATVAVPYCPAGVTVKI